MYYYMYPRDERFGGVLVPLLVGGLAGGAIVSASRPRPVFVTPPPYSPVPPVPPVPPYYY